MFTGLPDSQWQSQSSQSPAYSDRLVIMFTMYVTVFTCTCTHIHSMYSVCVQGLFQGGPGGAFAPPWDPFTPP